MKYLLPNAKVTSIALDSAHDVMAYYKYFQKEKYGTGRQPEHPRTGY
mgnify:CR=1 FL=1